MSSNSSTCRISDTTPTADDDDDDDDADDDDDDDVASIAASITAPISCDLASPTKLLLLLPLSMPLLPTFAVVVNEHASSSQRAYRVTSCSESLKKRDTSGARETSRAQHRRNATHRARAALVRSVDDDDDDDDDDTEEVSFVGASLSSASSSAERTS